MLNFQKIILTKTNPATRGEELFPVLKILRLPSIIFIQHYSVQVACFLFQSHCYVKIDATSYKGKEKMADGWWAIKISNYELYLLNDCVSIMITRIALLITPIPAHLVIERFEERTESSLNSIIDAKIWHCFMIIAFLVWTYMFVLLLPALVKATLNSPPRHLLRSGYFQFPCSRLLGCAAGRWWRVWDRCEAGADLKTLGAGWFKNPPLHVWHSLPLPCHVAPNCVLHCGASCVVSASAALAVPWVSSRPKCRLHVIEVIKEIGWRKEAGWVLASHSCI